MAFNFPSSPSNGDTYTANGFTYEYDGSKWIRKSPSTGAQGSTGPTGPSLSGQYEFVFAGPTGLERASYNPGDPTRAAIFYGTGNRYETATTPQEEVFMEVHGVGGATSQGGILFNLSNQGAGRWSTSTAPNGNEKNILLRANLSLIHI